MPRTDDRVARLGVQRGLDLSSVGRRVAAPANKALSTPQTPQNDAPLGLTALCIGSTVMGTARPHQALTQVT